MLNFKIKKEKKIERQEGDTGSLEFLITSEIDPADYTACFVCFSDATEHIELFRKTGADWVVDGQTITAILNEADTKGNAGTYRWELELYNDNYIHTLGRGDFVILPELIIDQRH